jgi:hypothetical protein
MKIRQLIQLDWTAVGKMSHLCGEWKQTTTRNHWEDVMTYSI